MAQDLKMIYQELCRQEQKLVNEMIAGTVLPDTDAPIQLRLDVIGEEIDKIKNKVGSATIQEWSEQIK